MSEASEIRHAQTDETANATGGTDAGADPTPVRDRPVKLECDGLWKIFGEPDAVRRVLAETDGKPDRRSLDEAGLTAAVRNADIDVREGEIFVIMGLSGSGKSTLVRCLSLLIEPSAGRLVFDDQDLLSIDEKALIDIRRHKMGMVFQHFALLPHLSTLKNVAFPLEIQGVARDESEAKAREMLELVGLKGREDAFPVALSGGQQQRVGIARSLATDPDLWFLDEPFSALDPLIRREMQDEFLRLQKLLGKTIVFITHDFDEAIRLADRIAIMNQGDIVQIGTPEDIVVRPADGYVEEFTKAVSKAKVLSARSLMGHYDPKADHGGSCHERERVSDFAGRIVSGIKPFKVLDPADRPVGQIEREAVIRVLAEGSP